MQQHQETFLNEFDELNQDVSVSFQYDVDEYQGYSIDIESEIKLKQLRKNPDIEYIELDQECTIAAQQKGANWNLARISQRNLPVDDTFEYDNNAGQNVDVYILDSGIRITHAEFGGRAIWGESFTGELTKTDEYGHGTHVAGIVAGKTVGVAKRANVIAVRVLDKVGSGRWSRVIAGLDWSYKMFLRRSRQAVINMSISGGYSSSLNSAIANIINLGIHVVVAAGNNAVDACTQSPASTTLAMTVGAVNSQDSMSSFSNYGTCVDILAPGEVIQSAYFTDDNASAFMSGTSQASPHVAGVEALLLGRDGKITVTDMALRLQNLATRNGLKNLYGNTVSSLLYNDPPANLKADVSSDNAEPDVFPDLILQQ